MRQLTLEDALDETIYLEDIPIGFSWIDDKGRTWHWNGKEWIKYENVSRMQ